MSGERNQNPKATSGHQERQAKVITLDHREDIFTEEFMCHGTCKCIDFPLVLSTFALLCVLPKNEFFTAWGLQAHSEKDEKKSKAQKQRHRSATV